MPEQNYPDPAAELSRIMCAKAKAGGYTWQKVETDPDFNPKDDELRLASEGQVPPTTEEINTMCQTHID